MKCQIPLHVKLNDCKCRQYKCVVFITQMEWSLVIWLYKRWAMLGKILERMKYVYYTLSYSVLAALRIQCIKTAKIHQVYVRYRVQHQAQVIIKMSIQQHFGIAVHLTLSPGSQPLDARHLSITLTTTSGPRILYPQKEQPQPTKYLWSGCQLKDGSTQGDQEDCDVQPRNEVGHSAFFSSQGELATFKIMLSWFFQVGKF